MLRQLGKNLSSCRVITTRCTRSRGPRGFFCLQVVRRGPVIVDVIRASRIDGVEVGANIEKARVSYWNG